LGAFTPLTRFFPKREFEVFRLWGRMHSQKWSKFVTRQHF
jgi:hypothetical protein